MKTLVQLYLLGTCPSGRPALSRSCRLTKAVHNISLFKHTTWKLKCLVTKGENSCDLSSFNRSVSKPR